MKTEEAITRIQNLIKMFRFRDRFSLGIATALDMAIEALQTQNVPDTNVGDTISRRAAIDTLRHVDEYNGRSVEAIRNLPSAQSERMKGKWIDDGTKLGYCCSQCGITLDDYVDAPEMTLLERPNYCPNCGADMIGDCANGY